MRDIYGGANARQVKKLAKIAKLVEDKEQLYLQMSDDELASQTQILRNRYQAGETLDQLLPDAFAVCREASARVLGQRHYHVQILGGIALHQGRICQMATGEGKTLTETLPAYLNALAGKGVHIITVNEYLATRDKDWMGKVFKFLGLTVGVTLTEQTDREKRLAYACDITYGTNSEFGFDYLRDNMATKRSQCVQRELNFVIIDEVDSILIDEARTPLIISGPSGKSSTMYVTANKFVCTLQKSTNTDDEGKTESEDIEPNGDYTVDLKDKTVRLTDKGVTKAERFFKVDNLSDPDNVELNNYINNALRAHGLMKRDDDYIVERGAVIIIDSFTGRKMEGRRFSNGLHQAIEAKEHVTIKEENKTLATITLQNYFRLYHKLSGMTGTAKTEEEEFNTIYNVDVVCIPTNLPLVRVDEQDYVYTTRAGKMRAIVNKIKELASKGQPLLVGTVTVEKSEELSAMLSAVGVKHNVLNAKNHKREAEIVAQAGRLGAVTIATNMAGRGTDILLGGNAEFLAKQEMKRLGYDDEQIEISTSFVKGDAQVTALQQKFAELVAKHKSAIQEERDKVIALGGLCVIGTERHESRRIDDQLRGRAGRQGDPGRSMFFISAEDEMIRIFAGDRMRNVLTMVGADEDFPIQHKIVSNIIQSAQKRLEGLHFSSRKNVLQFDDVNNAQRKVIYRERNAILDGGDVHDKILAMVPEYSRFALAEACDYNENVSAWNLDKLNKHLEVYVFGEPPYVTEQLVAECLEKCYGNRKLKPAQLVCDHIAQLVIDQLNFRYNEQVDVTELPFNEVERYFLLRIMDNLWMDHIDALDDLRKGVGLQAIGQHKPIDVYKKEAFDMYDKLNEQIRIQTIRTLLFSRVRVTTVSVAPAQTDEPINPNKSLNRLCPCGSGKKYKQCCYPKDLAAQGGVAPADETPTEPKPLTKQEQYALKRQQRKEAKNKGKKQ